MMPEMSKVEILGAQSEFIKALFDASSLGFMIVNNNGVLEYINGEAARIVGMEQENEITGRTLADIDNIMGCGIGDAFNSLLNGVPFRKSDHRCTNLKGDIVVINIFCSPYRRDDTDVAGFLAIIQDVTESYKQKSDLEQANNELNIMWQLSEALSAITDLDKALKTILTSVTANQGLAFNRAFLFLIDRDGNTLEGKLAVGPTSPEEAGQIWSQLSQKPRTLIELLNDFSIPEQNTSFGLTSMIQGWQINLSEPSIFADVVSSSRGTNVNGSSELTRLSRAILDRLNTSRLALAPITSKGHCFGLIAADNKITGKPISDADVRLLQTFANHTAVAIERSQLYDRLVEHAADLEEKNRQLAESQEQIVRIEKMSVIGELTSSIAHELRNPLTVIGGFAGLLLNAEKSDTNREYLNIISSEAKRAESVLHQVLDFKRSSYTEHSQIEFNQLVKKTYDLFISRARKRNKSPKLMMSDNDIFIHGNSDQIRHALYQFLMMTVEEMTDECQVDIAVNSDERSARMEIIFTGDNNARQKVIKTLKQIFGTATGTQKLSIIVAGETIKYHGGTYGVEGTADSIPKIYIELPLMGVK